MEGDFLLSIVFLHPISPKYLTMIYRPATLSDIDDVYELYMEKAANPFLTYDEMDREKFVGIYVGLLQTGTLFVAEMDHEIISTYRLIPKENRQSHTWYLGSFTVKNSMQGRGIGLQVLEHIKKQAIQHNKKRIELTVDINNEGAIRLYKKAGFVIEGQIKMSYRLGATGEYYDEFLMGLVMP